MSETMMTMTTLPEGYEYDQGRTAPPPRHYRADAIGVSCTRCAAAGDTEVDGFELTDDCTAWLCAACQTHIIRGYLDHLFCLRAQP